MPTIEAKPGGRVYAAPGSGLKDWSYGTELARQWPAADEIYSRIYKATGVDIYDVCARPTNNPVTDPAIAQPAAFGVGYASAEFLKQEVGPPDYLISLSASEFTVAAISGALDLEEGAILSKKRGEFQSQVAGGLGGQAVILLHDRTIGTKKRIHDLVDNLPGVHISNYLTPLKIGIGFKNEAFEDGELLDKFNLVNGVKRAMHNKGVEFSPHGEDVRQAQEMLANLMARTVRIKDATIPIASNYTGRLMKTGRTIGKNLIWQTSSPTQLNRGMAYLISRGVEDYIDIGPDVAMKKLLGDFVTLYGIQVRAAAELI